ncbi:hypothetical protein GGR56DRAFT_551506 [Xylariaceae sp. FL0804]|nr:hypothetical protein GGR56DRAFT_551506 [Xylariaceae sp. FL0804]
MPGIVDSLPAAEDVEPATASEPPVDKTPPRPYVVFQHHVELDVDFRKKRIRGRSNIIIVPIADVQEVYIDARQCEIDVEKITVSNCETQASYKDPVDCAWTPEHYQWSAPQWPIRRRYMEPLIRRRRKEVSALDHDLQCCTPVDGSLRVKLPSPDEVKRKNKDSQKSDQQDLLLQADGTVGGYRVSIPFQLKNISDGLHFVGVEEGDTRYPHLYSRHSIEPGTASSIFPCIDDPGSRNSWKISITCPRTLGDALHQASGSDLLNASQKRKRGEEEPRRREHYLTEEDKLLEMTVVCSGYLTSEVIHKDDDTKKTMTFEVDKNKAAKHIGFAVGPFEHVDLWSEFRSERDDVRLGANATKVHGYCLPGRVEEVRNTCDTLVTAIDHFVLSFGRYPFESYKVCFVDDMIEDSIPLCAFSLCSSRLLYPSDITDFEFATTRTLVYSLASQWFGVNIVPNMKTDIWLVVGIAWFMTDFFMRYLCGNNPFRFQMKTMADRLVEIDIKRPSLQDLGEHLYLGDFEVDFMNLKAPLVLFILDRRLSKSSGSAGISRIIARMVSKANTSGQASDEVLGSDAFRKACEKVGNTRLESFWNQWVVGAGCPRFDVFQRFNKKRLCVEMTVRQTQDIAAAKARLLDKDEFWRDVREETHAVYAGELQHSFTGPMTIRIHEADGTPYEHIVEIREDSAKSVKFEIPYNTKYKRLKRNRRQRERALASQAAGKGTEDGQKELYYLGDVLQHPDEVEEWEFRDWDDETEAKMDQESYEWIRMDADFEWICEMRTNLPAYMYASQLQQDRDVAAQQDSMLFLRRSFAKTGAHPLVSTILARTLLDHRYFYGLRVMAAEELPHHAVQEQVNWIGLKHLKKTFQHFFCHPNTNTPKPNNFEDRQQYMIQKAIPEAMARVRGEDGKCPREARRFILELLQANNNEDNVYSDQIYICKLIKALAICQVPDETKSKPKMAMSLSFGDGDEDEIMDDPIDPEPDEFREAALTEIERYRCMDEYFPSFQNCFTVAALDALCRLMKAKVIPTDHLMFVQYLQDRTIDVVRIKACEALIELNLLTNPKFLRFLLHMISTDPSPFVRSQLFKVFCRGLASIAIGENAEVKEKATQDPVRDVDGDDGLVVEQDTALDARQKAKARKEDLTAALAALKEETEDNEELQSAVWDALDSPILTVAERINLLEVCALLVAEVQVLLLKLKYPHAWTASWVEKERGKKTTIKFVRHLRTKSRKIYAAPPAPPLPPLAGKPEPKRTITLNLNRSQSFSAKPGLPVVPSPKQPLPPSVNGASKPPVPGVATKVPAAAPKSHGASTPKLPGAGAVKPVGSGVSKPLGAGTPKPVGTPKPAVGSPKPTTSSPKPASVGTKQSVTVATPRVVTPSVAQGQPLKNGHSHRDSISVQTPVRPSIEHAQAKTQKAPVKTNGNGHLAPAKPSRPPKRASTDSEGPRPTKIIKLDTSKIVSALEQRLGPSRKLVKVKFNAWDRVRSRKDTAGAASIRATPKHSKEEGPLATASAPQRPPTTGIPSSPPAPAAPAAGPPASSPLLSSSPLSSSQPLGQSQSGGSSSKPRKPLPDMRKPLPSAAPPNVAATANPAPPAHHVAPAASPPAPSKAPKLKIKVKPSQS